MTTIRRIAIAWVSALVAFGGVGVAQARPATGLAHSLPPPLPARAFARLDFGSDGAARSLYVGEAVPVALRAYFQAGTGVTLTGPPRLTTDGFTLADLPEKPHQTETSLRGLPYTMLTWTGVVTAVKPGATSPTIELPTQLSYVERVAPPPQRAPVADDQNDDDAQEDGRGGEPDPFASLLAQSPFASDPFFARMFKGRDPFGALGDPFAAMMDTGGRVRQHDVTLRAQARPVVVGDLPPGAPAGFTGAVGSFEPTATLSEHALAVGEPATVTLRVRGRGSFERLSSNGLARTADLDTYGVKSTFAAGPTPLAGEKTFTQTVVPRRAGSLTIPPLTVTYFNPQKRRYQTRETSPLPVTVAAVPAQPAGGTSLPTAGGDKGSETEAVSSGQVSGDHGVTTLTPAYRTPQYRWGLGIVAALATLAAAVGWGRRNLRVGRLASARRTRRAVADRLREVNAAAARGDAAGLFAAARNALQTRLSACWSVPPQAISAADVEARLGADGAGIRQILEQADRLTYAGSGALPSRELERWQQSIFTELRALERTT